MDQFEKNNFNIHEVIEHLNLNEKVDVDHGLMKRIASTLKKHWKNSLPVIHFTNDLISYGPNKLIKSAGIVDLITSNGLRKFSSVGFIPDESMNNEIVERHGSKKWMNLEHITEQEEKNNPRQFLEALDRIRKEFVHHGLRINRNKIGGEYSIPAVIIINGDIPKQSGDDSPVHAQLNKMTTKDDLIGYFRFDPNELIMYFLRGGAYIPKSKKFKDKKKYIPFREEFSSNDKTIRNEFLKQIIHKMATFRIHELKSYYDKLSDTDIKNKLILSAHELVDIYVITTKEFDQIFNDLDDKTSEEIINRRRKYRLINN